MARKKVLFICGSLNQTTMMHKISKHLPEYDQYFTAFYCDGIYKGFQKLGMLDWTIVGGQNRRNTESYFANHKLKVDYGGASHNYDLVFTCTDIIYPKNILDKPVILVQEGMTDPENFMYHVVKYARHVGMPRWLASTSTTGLSDIYTRFCVASDGYRKHFENKGVKADKIVVTGIPNFDNAAEYLTNDFPHKDYVLVATTDTRENFKWDNRRRFIERAVEIANGSQLIFRLHPNENHERSTREIALYAPGSLVFASGNTNHMVANCHTLITQFSSVVFVGMALGKAVYSYFDVSELSELLPIQNGGMSSLRIAEVGRELLGIPAEPMPTKILTLIQSRTGSSRLPGKVMMPLGDGNIQSQMIERVRAAKHVGTLALIITEEASDDPIYKMCQAMDVPCFRGNQLDLLDRHYQAWKHYGGDAVVKIPSDCPLIDPRIIDRVLGVYLANPEKYDYLSNLHPQSYPDGNDVEVMSVGALETAWREAKRPIEREHTTPYFWDNPERFRIGNVLWERGEDLSQSFRWTLDYREDYELIRAVFDTLYPQDPLFTVENIVELLENRPDLRAINQKYLGDAWYQRHAKELKTLNRTPTCVP